MPEPRKKKSAATLAGKRLVRFKDACLYGDLAQSSPATIYRFIQKGSITAYKHGGKLFVDLDSVDLYFKTLPRVGQKVRRRQADG